MRNSTGPLASGTVLVYLGACISVSVGFLMLQKERSEGAMEALRDSLEERVREQVAQLAADAREVERMNAELRQTVKERSEALTRALARIARRQGRRGIDAGTVLGERFELREVLGRGGMGAVYRAADRATGEPVAVKVIGAQSADELDAMRRFLREARASASVEHPGAVFARHVDVWHGQLYLVFELVEGASLDAVLARGEALAAAEVALLGARVAGVLAAAHEKGVLHRDVKPANVMLARAGEPVRLLDFGIARLRDAVLDDVTRTHGGALVGTPAYMAPEQALDARDAQGRSDVYALGTMLFELLAGRLPFEGREVGKQVVARLTRDAPSLASASPSTPERLRACVDRCLLRDADKRPSARELAAELDAVAAALGAREAALRSLAGPA